MSHLLLEPRPSWQKRRRRRSSATSVASSRPLCELELLDSNCQPNCQPQSDDLTSSNRTGANSKMAETSSNLLISSRRLERQSSPGRRASGRVKAPAGEAERPGTGGARARIIRKLFVRQLEARTTWAGCLAAFTIFWLALCAQLECGAQTLASDLLLGPEARGEFSHRLQRGQPPPPQQQANSIDLNQLVSLFNSIQSQQQRQRAAQQLPLGIMGGQRGGGGAGAPMSSTPANPFAAAANFQPTRRQQVQPGDARAPFVLASSAAPMLNFNGLAASGAAGRPSLQFPAVQRRPLGAANSQPELASAGRFGPGRAQAPGRTPLVPPPLSSRPAPPPPRPLSGFAPSGPPPGSSANSAISVVQSPANAIGSVAGASTRASLAPAAEQQPVASPSGQASTGAPPATTEPPASSTPSQEADSSASRNSTTISSLASPGADANSGGPAEQQQAPSSEQPSNSSWSPVQESAGGKQPQLTSLAPSPDIVTVPPGYEPSQAQQAQSYDISVSAQMGAQSSSRAASEASSSPSSSPSGLPSGTQSVVLASAAPTALTTIIWSPPSAAPPLVQPTRVLESAPVELATSQLVAQSTPAAETESSPSGEASSSPAPSSTTNVPTRSSASSSRAPTRIRDHSAATGGSGQSEPEQTRETVSNGVVYGKPEAEAAKPTGPPPPVPAHSAGSHTERQPAAAAAGRPFIQSAPLDSQVRPFSAGARQAQSHAAPPFKPSRPLHGPAAGPQVVGSAFSIVANGNQTMPSGDIQDYLAGQPQGVAEPTISAQGGPDPFELALEQAGEQVAAASVPAQTAAPAAPKLRRPTFRPKPAVPPIRIDSCIVGDDSSCDQSHNERCVTEYGISSCHCRPGFARLSQLRGFCSPVVSLQLSMKIDKLSDERRLVFNHTLENANSEEYQYLEFETLQAIAAGMQQSSLARHFMGARLNRFLERKGRIWANLSVALELSNATKSETSIQRLMAHELTKLQRQRQPLGDSTVVLDAAYRDSAAAAPQPAFSKLQDVNECASKELNDCSKHATCSNEFGSFTCQCLPGYEDKYLAEVSASPAGAQHNQSALQLDKSKLGRLCMGCSAAFCSNRGECSIVEGKKQCKCRANFMGARCDIDSEVLAVAIGGSLVGLLILLVTFWCLFVLNRRWRREQQKMDAMSATSGLTSGYNNNGPPSQYTSNASSNSLVSPGAAAAAAMAAAQQTARSMGGRSVAAASYMGQRFVGQLMGRAQPSLNQLQQHHLNSQHHNHHHHHHHQQQLSHHQLHQYALEQQAILAGSGSSSASSSAASQPLVCNPYHSNYTFEPDHLLIAPASSAGSSSEQTSPSGNSYRGIIGASSSNHSAAMMATGSAYTLSGHHHHHQHHHQHQLNHHHHTAKSQFGSQFHPMDQQQQQQHYNRTMAANLAQGNYDSRWRTLQQPDSSKINSSLSGYYLVNR